MFCILEVGGRLMERLGTVKKATLNPAFSDDEIVSILFEFLITLE